MREWLQVGPSSRTGKTHLQLKVVYKEMVSSEHSPLHDNKEKQIVAYRIADKEITKVVGLCLYKKVVLQQYVRLHNFRLCKGLVYNSTNK